MTDYELLYSKFELKDEDSQRLNELHRIYKTCQSPVGKIIVTTAITDATGTEVLESEVKNAKLV